MNAPRLDPAQLRKRMLIFYFAAGVNFLMALWVWSAGSTQTGGGTLTLIMLVFLAFAGLNYYMGRRIGRFLRRAANAPQPGTASAAQSAGKVNE
jgi:hypothetical protein